MFHEGDKIRINSNCEGHPSWIGKYGYIISFNEVKWLFPGSYDCIMEDSETQVHWYPREFDLVESLEDSVKEKLGEDYQ